MTGPCHSISKKLRRQLVSFFIVLDGAAGKLNSSYQTRVGDETYTLLPIAAVVAEKNLEDRKVMEEDAS